MVIAGGSSVWLQMRRIRTTSRRTIVPSAMMVPVAFMIEVRDLHKAFGKVIAVDGATFIARDGEITGLLGPNGAGKTTTLRCLYTLMQPDRGQVLVDGIDAAADPIAVRRSLGVLPDARGLYKRLSARENIAYFGRLQGIDEATIRLRTDAAIAALEMGDFANRHA